MLGILTGSGELPFIAARQLEREGRDFHLFVVEGQGVPTDHSYIHKSTPVTITRWGSVVRALRKQGITELLLLGKIDKKILFEKPRFDWRALWILAKMLNQSDSNFFRVLAADLAGFGIEVISQRKYLSQLFPGPGFLGKSKVSRRQKKDAAYAFPLAKKIAELDIGQTIVVGQGAILSIEAIEGTNEAIRRGGELARGRPALVCKVSRVNQDDRFDIPAVGISTLETMRAAGIRLLVFEAGRTFIVTPEKLHERAREYGMTLWGVTGEEFG